ncbi:MAG TPA: diguanylate cyclase [Solirubrobacteraceae bacterium]|nr:diguanylate cyclase [Solirubrobacteraceae bacterium]
MSADIAGVVIADATAQGYPLTYVSPGFEQLTGYRAEQVLGRNCSLLQGPETDAQAIEYLRREIAAGREAYVTLLNYRSDGSTFWNEVALAPQHDATGRLVSYLGVQKDVTERLRSAQRIEELAYLDSLTGLANRASMNREVDIAVLAAGEAMTEVAILFLDLDDFKRVNDTFGHLVGDELLRVVAERLRSVVRPDDLLARIGGDEFLVMMTGARGLTDAATHVASRILSTLREPVSLSIGQIAIGASVGVSSYPRDAASAEELLRHADMAMYIAKRSGKNVFHVHVLGQDASFGRVILREAAAGPSAREISELERILAEEHVTSVFQPIVDMVTSETVAYEALSRGPRGSCLERPDALFAAAAAAGRVTELDWLCRATAVRSAMEAGLGRKQSLFLNCEPSALGQPCPERHAGVWNAALHELDLVLEITERALTARPAELSRTIAESRAAGFGIALDDLGADVRSLALLPFVEPDVIKLDLRLVQQRPSTDQAGIVSAVAAESERTGATVLAEGIETEAHLAVARSLGARLGQGWLWGRPGPLAPTVRTAWQRHSLRNRSGAGRTPFEVVSAGRQTELATKELLLPISHLMESRALRIGEGAVILSAFQHAHRFTPATARRYETLARSASLCAAFGIGLVDEPVPGVRGASLDEDDPLAGEWSVLVIGPHFTGALVAQDLGDTGPDRQRRFHFTTSYERGLVLAAARTLIERISPLAA